MAEQLNKEKDMETVYELAKTTLKGWKIEKLRNTVYATYRVDILSAREFVALSIEYSTQYNYVLRFICRLTKSISVSYDKSAQTIEILGNMLESMISSSLDLKKFMRNKHDYLNWGISK